MRGQMNVSIKTFGFVRHVQQNILKFKKSYLNSFLFEIWEKLSNIIWFISRVKDTNKYITNQKRRELCVDDDQTDIFYQLFSLLCAPCWANSANWQQARQWLFVGRQSAQRYLRIYLAVFTSLLSLSLLWLDCTNQIENLGLICSLFRCIIKRNVCLLCCSEYGVK